MQDLFFMAGCIIRIVTLLLLVTSVKGYGQNYDQTIRGRVTDLSNGFAVAGAVIQLNNEDQPKAVTDSSGRFVFKNIPPGVYSLYFTAEGYKAFFLKNITHISGKETVLDVPLLKQEVSLQEVTVNETYIAPFNSAEITVEQSQKYAAAFYDPARVVTSLPGVVNADDQANHLIVRGNSPNSIQWKIEGVEVVNPNHLDNAGTASDKMSFNGGGVNILSAQLLSNSSFHFAPYNAIHGNALAGIFDMRLRRGNNQKREHTFQFSLLGTDLSTEGPISNQSQSSYLVNYRYSTVGLLSKIGVNFGDEKINFQDLAFNVTLPTERAIITLFGMGGKSYNISSGKQDPEERFYQKDFQKINYTSAMGALGMTFKKFFANNSFTDFSFCSSLKESSRNSSNLTDTIFNLAAEDDRFDQRKLSFHGAYTKEINEGTFIKAGSYIMEERIVYASSQFMMLQNTEAVNLVLLQPYVNLKSSFKRMDYEAGVHLQYHSLSSSFLAQPRISALINLNEKNFLTISSGLYSQSQAPSVYFYQYMENGVAVLPNRDFGPTKSFQLSLSHTLRRGTFYIKNELYHQYLYDVPVERDSLSAFSVLNLFNELAPAPLVNSGTGKNYGYVLTVSKEIKSFYFLTGFSLYNSLYRGSDGVERETRFNGRFSSTFTSGKEWTWNKDNINKTFSIDLRSAYRGGFKESSFSESNLISYNQTFDRNLKDYLRFDLRLSLKKNKKSSTRTLALDIQNLTNRKNIAFNYYDWAQKEVVTKYQLGLIPILSYKVHF